MRDTGVEPVSKVWKTFILTAIRIPQSDRGIIANYINNRIKEIVLLFCSYAHDYRIVVAGKNLSCLFCSHVVVS